MGAQMPTVEITLPLQQQQKQYVVRGVACARRSPLVCAELNTTVVGGTGFAVRAGMYRYMGRPALGITLCTDTVELYAGIGSCRYSSPIPIQEPVPV